jgi:hypothetical protein
MKTLNFVCAGLALVGGIVSAVLWRDLHAQRALMAEWQRAHPEVASAGPEKLSPSNPPSAGTLAAQTATAAEIPVARIVTPGASERIALERQQLADPEYRRKAAAQLRTALQQDYPGLVEKLGLSPNEADRLFDLLAEQQLELRALPPLTLANSAPHDPSVLRGMIQVRQETQRRQEESLTSLLGDERYARWQEYQQTRRARQQVAQQYAAPMKALGQPLNEAQEQALSAVLVAEGRRQQQEIQRLRATGEQPRAVNAAQAMEETARRREESNGRVLAAAKPLLSGPQLESLRTILDQQVAIMRRTGFPRP